ncbi:MAG: hypothetical protein Q7U11_17250 [Phenylobacterium sp.]|nr:hypothetical protein [Phenylobacterium sp.]
MMTSAVDQIRDRLDVVDGSIAAMEESMTLLRAERAELANALRVIERFADADELAPRLEPDLDKRRVEPSEPAASIAMDPEKRKPDNIPSVPDMILEVLLKPHLLGDPGMEPKDILARIRERWWPEAPSTTVGPIAWRMAKDKRLVKSGGTYSLPRKSGEGEALSAPKPTLMLFDDVIKPRAESSQASPLGGTV